MGDFFKGKKIHWSEGIYLTPQHLQQLQDYVDDTIINTTHIREYYEAVLELKIDNLAISKGIFKIQKFIGILKNRKYVNYNCMLPNQNDNYDLSIDLQEHSSAFHINNQIILYICLTDKLTTVEENIVDKYDNTQSLNLLKDVENLVIVPDYLLTGNHIGIPIGKVLWKNNIFVIDEDYQYPIVVINNEHVIYKYIVDFINNMRVSAANITSQYLRDKTKKDLVVEKYQSFFPDVLVLESKLLSKVLLPIEVFMTLHKIFGSLSILKLTNLPMIKKYNHYNILEDIKNLINDINNILQEFELLGERIFFQLSDDNEYIVGNNKFSQSFFHITLDESIFNSTSLFLLVEMDINNNQQDIIKWIENCKIIGKDKVKEIIYRRSRGIQKQITENTNFGKNIVIVEIIMSSFKELLSINEKELYVFNTISTFLPKTLSLCVIKDH
ncbi:hypothetical protein AB836_01530 [Rickettsiales bacterium (ex Bugula neritina AB1)]|nr:hypothetical protein AB836_01530 [Rickettsiales bacterium (ex Bugula neritina AB1)]